MKMDKQYFLETIVGDRLSKDPDHTEKARAFYACFWGDVLSSELNDYCGTAVSKESGGSRHSYRGDTIITFNRIAGCAIRLLPSYSKMSYIPDSQEERLEIIQCDKTISKDVQVKFNTFYHLYHTLANFMPLISAERPSNINLLKNNTYLDYPDLFFKAIKNYYQNNSGFSKYFSKSPNKEYFSMFTNWKDFVEKNYLQDFFECDDYQTPKIFIPNLVRMPYRSAIALTLEKEEKKKCLEYIESFLDQANTIIEKRAERLQSVKGG